MAWTLLCIKHPPPPSSSLVSSCQLTSCQHLLSMFNVCIMNDIYIQITQSNMKRQELLHKQHAPLVQSNIFSHGSGIALGHYFGHKI